MSIDSKKSEQPRKKLHIPSLGEMGELHAKDYLLDCGFILLDHNWRYSRLGELDLVMSEYTDYGLALVGIEVKTRSGTGFGDPLEAITHAKLARLRKLVYAWQQEHDFRCDLLRIDGVGILWRGCEGPIVNHVRGLA